MPGHLLSRRGALLLLAVNIAIGSVSFTLVQLALRELTPLALACGRVVVSAAMFTIVVVRAPEKRRRIEPRDRWRIFLCGFLGSAVFHLLFNWGQLRVPVAIAAVIMSSYPVLTTIGEVVFLHHRLTRAQAGGIALTTLGCVVIGLTGDRSGAGSTWGVIAIAAAAVSWAAVTVITRGVAHRYDSWWINTPGTVVGALFMLVISAGQLHQLAELSLRGWVAVIWLGSASSAFIYWSLARVMQVMSATTTTAITTIVTPLGILVAWAVLGTAPTLVEVFAGAVVIAGVLIVVLRDDGREPIIDDVGAAAHSTGV